MLEKLDDLKLFFKNNSKVILSNLENIKYKDQPISYLTFYKFFSEIESFLTNQCIYSSYRKSLSTYRRFDFWTLQNNIILDASGSILTEYTLNETKFKVEPQDSVFNYSDTIIHIKDANSYKSYIEKKFDKNRTSSTKKYLEPIKKFIKKNLKDQEDEILIVNYKDHHSFFDEFKNIVYIHNSWHGNILGKNTWRTCNKLFINSTFNLPAQAYILIYSFYSDKPIRKTDLRIKTENNKRVFSNKKIELLKQNYILHNLYQTIKRVNRDLDKKCDIYVVTNNAHFQNKINNLLQDVNLAYDYNVELPKTIQEEKKETNEKYIAIANELERLSRTDRNYYKEFYKTEFCKKTGLKSAKLKQELYYNKAQRELCEKYGVNLIQTFKTGSRLIVFKQ